MDETKLFRLRELLHRCGIRADDIPDDVLSEGYNMLVQDVFSEVLKQTVYPANGINTSDVIDWIHESPRRNPEIAFTSGLDRMCADLIRVAESEMSVRLDRDLEESGLEIRAIEGWEGGD